MEKGTYYRSRRRRCSPLARILTFLLVSVVLFFGVSVFFRIHEFTVIGDTRYSTEEIAAASGISRGNNLIFIRPEEAVRNIERNLPYVANAQVTRRFPSRVEIQITEALALAYVPYGTRYVILDRAAKVLEIADERPDGMISILGVEIAEAPRAGENLSFGEAERQRLVYVQDILNMLQQLGLYPNVLQIDMENLLDPTLYYDGRLIVRLGPNRQLPRKMNLLRSILEELNEQDAGVIDLNPESPIFRPAPTAEREGEG